ncbi:hypothetical protein GCM10008927_10970 [Amylibacter ulvae]|uniref:Uncharacterized protein n=1 Tax=Paramylibacter ulvae TaxID=1651968 RepID=A0ABQ3CZB1_9RHOB|nr:hypothetical protein GCM10008927_10970 [Amylibacter ulvae]
MILAIIGIGILFGLTASVSSLVVGIPLIFAFAIYIIASIFGATATCAYFFIKSYICRNQTAVTTG